MRSLLKKILQPFLSRLAAWYFSKPQKYRYKNLKVIVYPGVFAPHLIISTKIFLEYLDTLTLYRVKVLEMGSGSGILSLLAAEKEGEVTAVDISPKAVENTQKNLERYGHDAIVLRSDLFTELPAQTFDLVLVNPPYYPRKPKEIEEHAWYCGENFEYFTQFFAQVGNYLEEKGRILMILSEDCELDTIQKIGKQNGFIFKKVVEKKKAMEMNYIFEITLEAPSK